MTSRMPPVPPDNQSHKGTGDSKQMSAEDVLGENTIEGDLENDVNFAGDVDEDVAYSGAPRKGRRPQMQGKKTHEQQVRILERKPDLPDARELDQALRSEDSTVRRASAPNEQSGHKSRE